jgi:hypothetical protein
MSAVDWWKRLQTETLLGLFASGVRWNILRLVGKLRAILVSSRAIEILQQSIRTIPTQSSHFVHMQFARLFFAIKRARRRLQKISGDDGRLCSWQKIPPTRRPAALDAGLKSKYVLRVDYCKASISRVMVRFKSLSERLSSSILLMECSTVVWCLPPNCRPISGSEAVVSCLTIYMAT